MGGQQIGARVWHPARPSQGPQFMEGTRPLRSKTLITL